MEQSIDMSDEVKTLGFKFSFRCFTLYDPRARAELGRSGVSDSLQLHGLQPARLLRPCGFSRQEYWSG